MDLLPSTTFNRASLPARGRQLNTIHEEPESSQSGRSDSEGDGSDQTVVGRPAGWDAKTFVAAPRKSSRLANSITAASPISRDASPCSSNDSDADGRARSRYSGSDGGTIFSDDSCPSLSSNPTTFATDSGRNSIASTKSGASRNRYPAILIPRSSWASVEGPVKEVTLGMSPSHKIALSPAVLSSLSRALPADNAPPSLAGSSAASDSPCVLSISAPATPDMRQLEVQEGHSWGDVQPLPHTQNHLEIALDDEHSIVLSPAEAHEPMSAISASAGPLSALISPREREWGSMVGSFPVVPGATPVSREAPLEDSIRALDKPRRVLPSDNGVFLPNDAMKTLDRLTREVSPDEKTELSRLERTNQEMQERTSPSIPSRPRSADGMTPQSEGSFAKLSDYSFTQLSIPSPGGFFSSLQANARHTWCIPTSRQNSVPTSAVAENFYYNWPLIASAKASPTKQTTLTIKDSDTDGPPTARQAEFDKSVRTPPRRHSGSSEEQDLYGASPSPKKIPSPAGFEYEEAYDEELKQAAEANLDRTSTWLAAQTSYLSALREANPVNDPADYPPTPHPFSDDNHARSESIDSNIRKTVRFLEQAKAAHSSPTGTVAAASCQTSPESDSDPKAEPIFLQAFQLLIDNRKCQDAFLHAASRLEAVRAGRTLLSSRHIQSLLGHHVIINPIRPKYSGPFNGNPRATGIFERSKEALAYEAMERSQQASQTVQPPTWKVDALRALYGGQLVASPAACARLTQRATVPLTDPACVGRKRLRVLDLGGESTASWAWHAALEWPNVKIYTVITKDQARSQRPLGETKPAGPSNHRTVSVPHLWQLPFRSNHFDVVSARSLHALLKHNPVPGVPEIDEWDLALKECMRMLKPGGTLDFMVLDSTIANARPGGMAEKLSVEFGFELHRRGYEREAGRGWLRRMGREGFVSVKRGWVFLPMGRKVEKSEMEMGMESDLRSLREYDRGMLMKGGTGEKKDFVPAPRPVSEVSTISRIVKQYMDVEAVQGPVGSTADVADITGLLGARMWEEWIVKLRREAGWGESRLLEGIDEALEEGKMCGSGWKLLVGWARKPRREERKKERSCLRGKIMVALGDEDKSGASGRNSPVDREQKERSPEMGEIPMLIQASPLTGLAVGRSSVDGMI